VPWKLTQPSPVHIRNPCGTLHPRRLQPLPPIFSDVESKGSETAERATPVSKAGTESKLDDEESAREKASELDTCKSND
jgi:hypothetical protein